MRNKSSFKIDSEVQYEKTMLEIEALMDKGEANLTNAENEKTRDMALAAQDWEQKHYRVAAPQTLDEMIALRMYEMHLSQTKLSETLGISNAKLSLILNKKQKPDIVFLKAVHKKLNVDAGFILEHV